jgi:hypothetical protein
VRAGIRRLALLVAVVFGGTVLVSGFFGLVSGGNLGTAVATGSYLVGSLLIVVGVLVGVRGPLRSEASGDAGLFGLGFARRRVRRASDDERHDTVVSAAVFVALGFTLVLFGIAVDSTVHLV